MIYEDLKGKHVLVTGSSSGIGAETAIAFARQGAIVGVHYFRTKDGGEKTLNEVIKYSQGRLFCADMRDEKQVQKLIDDFVHSIGEIDILVNNAGTLIERQDIQNATISYFDDIFDTNVKSCWLATRAAYPYLKKTKGCIVNVGSVAGHNGGAGGSGIYASAKAAIHTLTIAMAREFAPDRIRVNCVVPGLIETRFHERFSTPQRKAQLAQENPRGRNGTAGDCANAILFLASQAADFINGEYLAVNGGAYMRV